MVTALALELIQCVVRLPAPPEDEHPGEKDDGKSNKRDDRVSQAVGEGLRGWRYIVGRMGQH